jgi:hypothetical protein
MAGSHRIVKNLSNEESVRFCSSPTDHVWDEDKENSLLISPFQAALINSAGISPG